MQDTIDLVARLRDLEVRISCARESWHLSFKQCAYLHAIEHGLAELRATVTDDRARAEDLRSEDGRWTQPQLELEPATRPLARRG